MPCSYDGHVIGDGILFHLDENNFVFVGRAPTANWIQFHGETGGYDVQIVKDDRSPSRPMGKPVMRKHYRYQIQGPNAEKVIEKLNGGPFADIKFFHMDDIKIKGRKVRALRHGMAGAPGLEIWGPYEEGEEIARRHRRGRQGIRHAQVGARAYATNTLESGWIPSPLPAVYTDEQHEELPRMAARPIQYEATGSIGGSFVSNNIEDYYVTPYELGYGPFVKFDHDFIGREALKKMADKPHRRKVTFAWNGDDVAKVFHSMFQHGQDDLQVHRPAAVELRLGVYDKIIERRQDRSASRCSPATATTSARMLSLGIVDPERRVGAEVTLVWGEENGGTKKTTVERHKQIEIRAIVSPVPYSRVARETYAEGWRTNSPLEPRPIGRTGPAGKPCRAAPFGGRGEAMGGARQPFPLAPRAATRTGWRPSLP